MPSASPQPPPTRVFDSGGFRDLARPTAGYRRALGREILGHAAVRHVEDRQSRVGGRYTLIRRVSPRALESIVKVSPNVREPVCLRPARA
jgi:hypothetical protein